MKASAVRPFGSNVSSVSSVASTLASILAFAGCAHTGTARPSRVAVLPLDGIGIPADEKARLDRAIRRQIRQTVQVPVVQRSTASRHPGSADPCSAQAGQREAACAAEVGRALDASHVVFGAAGRLGDTRMLRLKLLRVREATVVRAVEETLFGPGTTVERSMNDVTARLFDLPRPRPWYARWWTWALAGAALSAAVVLPVVLTRASDSTYKDVPFP